MNIWPTWLWLNNEFVYYDMSINNFSINTLLFCHFYSSFLDDYQRKKRLFLLSDATTFECYWFYITAIAVWKPVFFFFIVRTKLVIVDRLFITIFYNLLLCVFRVPFKYFVITYLHNTFIIFILKRFQHQIHV